MRFFIVSLALAFAPAALACGGDCSGDCAKQAESADKDVAAVAAADGTKLTLAVKGVHCPMTAGMVKAALANLDGVKAVAVDTAGKTLVAFDAAKTDQSKLLAAVAALDGFSAEVPKQG